VLLQKWCVAPCFVLIASVMLRTPQRALQSAGPPHTPPHTAPHPAYLCVLGPVLPPLPAAVEGAAVVPVVAVRAGLPAGQAVRLHVIGGEPDAWVWFESSGFESSGVGLGLIVGIWLPLLLVLLLLLLLCT